MSNAIKFTEQGHVRITLDLMNTEVPARALMQLTVQDTGVGISAEDQQRLFEPFAQAENSSQQGRSGAGLGLVISRNLCEMMGGQLQLNSQPGIGTQVCISLALETLPIQLSTVKSEAAIKTSQTPLRVLVVDDHPANRLLMCQQLEFLGHHFSIAENGCSGLALWRAGHFDLVIVDCNMPLMNGYELTRAIRQHELQARCPPCTVLGFTANAQPEEIQRCKQAGMNDCLFKPLSLSLLSQWVDGITPTCAPPAFNLQNMNMLTGGNPAQARRLLAELLKSSRLDRQELLALSPEHDRAALAVVAHKIKGAARIAQASRVIECCDALEQACAEALSTDEIARRCEASNRAMLDLENALQQQLTVSDQSTMSLP
ncbi:hypothetical protein EMIT0232MI5_60269 [Pseudomonas sp. IT-232MI5]